MSCALLAGIGGACLVASPDARAQSPEDLASARQLGVDGIQLADKGDCAGAIPKLTAAEKLHHAPTTLERLGECEIKVGKLVSGTERLNQVLREQLPPNAPPAFAAAQKRAQDALPAAQSRIGRLRLHVDGAPPDQVSATIDGAPVPSAMFDSARPTDPGSHQVSASAPGYKPAATTVVVSDGTESAASLTLVRDPSAPTATAPATAGPATSAAATTASSGSPPPSSPPQGGGANVPAIVSFVAGGVGLAAGTVFGLLALSTKSSLDGECGPTKKTCSSSGDVSSLATNAWVSNVGFGIGIVGAALGTYFLVSHHGGEKTGAASPHIDPWIGLGSAGVGGTFQ
ncbi:MAG: hypothetical protein ACRENE_10940 [Polyangiaceae bacterium]